MYKVKVSISTILATIIIAQNRIMETKELWLHSLSTHQHSKQSLSLEGVFQKLSFQLPTLCWCADKRPKPKEKATFWKNLCVCGLVISQSETLPEVLIRNHQSPNCQLFKKKGKDSIIYICNDRAFGTCCKMWLMIFICRSVGPQINDHKSNWFKT